MAAAAWVVPGSKAAFLSSRCLPGVSRHEGIPVHTVAGCGELRTRRAAKARLRSMLSTAAARSTIWGGSPWDSPG